MNLKKIYYALFLCCFISRYTVAHEEQICYPKDKTRCREHNVDFKTLKLYCSFLPEEKKVLGKAIYTFTPLQLQADTLFLDAPNILIKTITLENTPQRFTVNKEGVSIFFKNSLIKDSTYTLEIVYETNPQKGIYFIGWDDSKNISRKQIWTQGQGIDNRYWIPSYDDVSDKLITETIVTFDSTYEVISNGVLQSVKNDGKNKIWHYAMSKPHVMYLVMLGIGKYKYKDMKSKNGVISRQFYYPDKEPAFESTYRYSNEMMDWMESELQYTYPWNAIYRNVPCQDFMYGAMENTAATIYTDIYHQDARVALDRSYVNTNAHELTHQWFGDLVTEWSGTHHWLHESFATHYAKHFIKHQLGENEFQHIRESELSQTLGAAKQNRLPIANASAGSSRHYPKGSLVLDMLRYVVGNEAYRKAITYYLQKHQYKNVDTHDLYIAFMETLGVNLDWFFDEWVLRGGEPNYEIFQEETEKNIQLFVKQTHKKDELCSNFKMPINVEVFYENGTKDSVRTWIEHDVDTVTFTKKSAKISYVLFDGENQILKSYQYKRPLEQIKNQTLQAPYITARLEGVKSLRDSAFETKKAILYASFSRDSFKLVREEVIQQLAADSSTKTLQVFNDAMLYGDHYTRRAAISEIKRIYPEVKTGAEKLLQDSLYSTTNNALNKLCKAYPKEQKKYLEQTKNVHGASENVRISWLKFSAMSDKKWVDSLIRFASNSYEFRTRINAFEALKEVDIYKPSIVEPLFTAATHFNSRLSNATWAPMKHFYKKNPADFKKYFAAHTWDTWQKERIEIWFKQWD